MTYSANSFTLLDGWNTLPDETRLKILTHVFGRAHAIDHKEYAEIVDSTFLPLLLTPFNNMATEALYANNTFKISTESKMVPRSFHNDFIRHIVIDMPLDRWFSNWKVLEKLCDGTFSFRRLYRIDIKFRSHGDVNQWNWFVKDHPCNLELLIPDVKELSVRFDFQLDEPGDYCVQPSYQDDTSLYLVFFQRISLQKYLPESLVMRSHPPKAVSTPNDSVSYYFSDSSGKECTQAQLPVVSTEVSSSDIQLNKYHLDKVSLVRFQSK